MAARPAILAGLLVLCALVKLGAAVLPAPRDHPIGILPPLALVDEGRRALGERLFADPRLSGDGTRSCAGCHDLRSNGASARRRDLAPDGTELPLNTATVFNAALNFRLGWEGRARSLEAQTEALLRNPAIMGADPEVVLRRLSADPALAAEFRAIYRREPDAPALIDALSTFQRSLVTPRSRFDLWLGGVEEAITPAEREGYLLFRSIGCAACHQGVNIGGNLFQYHGIFHALAAPEPRMLRVPSLRNVAVTAPYFHDGSAATLEDAVRGMGLAQLNLVMEEAQVAAIVAFLRSLTGSYRGAPVTAPP
ncbi:cytochrome-c peroxidase [Falsiroseomonas sp.]|uniref:cytochrome-c peroxidase n=1 Tax=Falsiroseomonas sp. TaxID=2870721 RepID=UPI003F70DB7F